MAKNDTILIDAIIAQRRETLLPSDDPGEVFEYLALEQILKAYDLSPDELESGWIDGRGDGGIDGFYILINGRLLTAINEFPLPKSNVKIDVYLINCKHQDSFKAAPINLLIATSIYLFDLTKDRRDLSDLYSSDLLDIREIFSSSYKQLAISSPKIEIHYAYASRGDASDIGQEVNSKAKQIVSTVANYFSNSTVAFDFFGSAELVALYRKHKQFKLELPFSDHLTGSGNSYIATVKLDDYYKFISDEDGSLRRYLFDSNVRDYLGRTKVNEDIAESLKDNSTPDFWWLNNGITILVTNAAINGKTFILTDIQIVNGLQTTETIFDQFSSGNTISSERTLSIKIIVSQDETLRDKIIRATNNQSTVESIALHATDKIQRDIENILDRHGWYYERRKNYYKNVGKPIHRFATPMFVAGAFVAIVLKDPLKASRFKSRFLRAPESYRAVFSEETPIEVWPRLVCIAKASENVMLSAQRRDGSYGERFLRIWRGLLALVYVARVTGRFDFGIRTLLELSADDVKDHIMQECWDRVRKYRGGSVQLSARIINEVCVEFSTAHGLTGVGAIGNKTLPAVNPKPPVKGSGPEWEALVETVDMLLPSQPWQKGIHREVAEKIGVSPAKVQGAIHELIDRGKRLSQIDGIVLGPKVDLLPKAEET